MNAATIYWNKIEQLKTKTSNLEKPLRESKQTKPFDVVFAHDNSGEIFDAADSVKAPEESTKRSESISWESQEEMPPTEGTLDCHNEKS